MQTVKFQCGGCGNHMAVGGQLAGKQVRCPHCQQVVVAPAAVPTPAAPSPALPPGPMFRMPVQGDDDSIFDSPEGITDDLFGAPRQPPVMMPPSQAMSHPPAAVAPPPPPPPPVSAPAAPNPMEGFSAPAGNGAAESDSAGLILSDEPAGAAARRFAQQRTKKDSMLTIYLLIFLVPYAVFMTIIAIALFFKSPKESSPTPAGPFDQFEKMLDWPRDSEDPYDDFKKGKRVTYDYIRDDKPLAAHLRVPLGKEIQIGDLLVKPLQVEQRRIKYGYESGAQPHDSADDALVLTLEVQNTAQDYAFAPNDLFFNRQWKDEWVQEKKRAKSDRPYTVLEIGAQRFYGGACEWWPKGKNASKWRGDRDEHRIYVQGQEHTRKLQPGEKTTLIVCTDPDNKETIDAKEKHKGNFLWRVQLRRGLVAVKQRGVASATAVIGVEFKKNDVKVP